MAPTLHLEPGVVAAYSYPISGLLDVGCWPRGIDSVAEEVSAALAELHLRLAPDRRRGALEVHEAAHEPRQRRRGALRSVRRRWRAVVTRTVGGPRRPRRRRDPVRVRRGGGGPAGGPAQVGARSTVAGARAAPRGRAWPPAGPSRPMTSTARSCASAPRPACPHRRTRSWSRPWTSWSRPARSRGPSTRPHCWRDSAATDDVEARRVTRQRPGARPSPRPGTDRRTVAATPAAPSA